MRDFSQTPRLIAAGREAGRAMVAAELRASAIRRPLDADVARTATTPPQPQCPLPNAQPPSVRMCMGVARATPMSYRSQGDAYVTYERRWG